MHYIACTLWVQCNADVRRGASLVAGIGVGFEVFVNGHEAAMKRFDDFEEFFVFCAGNDLGG